MPLEALDLRASVLRGSSGSFTPPLSGDTSLSVFTINGFSATDGGTTDLPNSTEGDEITDLTIVTTPTDSNATVGTKTLTPTALVSGSGNLLEFDVTAENLAVQHYNVTLNVAAAPSIFTYLRPGGVDSYFRPDGVSIYLQP